MLTSRQRWAFVALFVLAALLRATRLGEPLTERHASALGILGGTLRGQLRYGVLTTGFRAVQATGDYPIEAEHAHPTHWPASVLPHWFVVRAAGCDSEHDLRAWHVRLGPYLAGVLASLALIPLLLSVLPPPQAMLAFGLWAIAPIHAFFGVAGIGEFGVEQTAAFTGWALLLWHYRAPCAGKRVAALLALAVGVWCTWSGTYGCCVAFFLALLHPAPSWRVRLQRAALIGAWFVACVAALVGWAHATGVLPDLLTHGRQRASGMSPIRLLTARATWVTYYCSPALIVGGLAYAWRARRAFTTDGLAPVDALIAGIAAWCALALLAFGNAIGHHDFYTHDTALLLTLASVVVTASWAPTRRWLLLGAAALWLGGSLVAENVLAPYGSPLTQPYGVAVGRHTAFGEECLTNLKVLVRATGLDARSRTAHAADLKAIARYRADDPGYRWFVTATADTARRGIGIADLPLIRRIRWDDPAWLRRRFGFVPEDAPLLARLRARYPVEERDGFLFFDLSRPRD